MLSEQPRRRTPIALVVEDSAEARHLLWTILARAGFSVATAATGEEALAVAWSRDPDLILLDVGLPGMNGFDTCRRLREFTDAYIIMVTAKDDVTDKVDGFGAGADDYLTKPFAAEELAVRIGAVMSRPQRT
jgi:two-component system, OmpR family, response regulator